MNHIGILAYGSLIDDPGQEIQSVIANRIECVITPFRVEFARKSSRRDDAQTLVPVEEGGTFVKAVILVLREGISEVNATNMLWRRETNRVGGNQTYTPVNPGPNTVCIERLENFYNIAVVLYTKIAPNIHNLTSQRLADLAIRSACAEAGSQERDGISYLIAAKRNRIKTPLMTEYENEILRQTKTTSLEDALRALRADSA